MKRRPRKISVGKSVYRLRTRRIDGFFGETDWDSRTISVARGLAPPVEAKTIIHEIVHVLLDEAGLMGSGSVARVSERVCQGLESPLASLLVDNKALIAWLQEALKK